MTGTWQLVRLILRRDRIIMPVWVLFIALVPVSYIATIDGLFPTAVEKAQYAATSASNAGFVALYGRLFGSSIGELVAWRAGFIPIVIGLAVILTVIRHTRTEEEAGRRELIGSTVVGRHAGLAAALITAGGASLVLGLVLAGAMSGNDMPGSGSLAFGLEMAASGWVFAGIAAIAAQLTASAGTARGIAITVLGVAFVLRVVGDISGMTDGPLAWMSGLSPFGWVQAIRPYGDDKFWLVLVVLAATVVLTAVAVALSGRRDVGVGMVPPRPGPATGALSSPLGLAWRLHRGLMAGWAGGFVALGVVLGYLAEGVGDLVGDNQAMKDVFARLGGASGLIDAYLAGMTGFFGLIAGAYAIQAMLRARAEETAGHAEPVLATATGRLGWMGSHLLFSLVGPAVVLVAAGLAMGITHGLNVGDVGGELPRLLAGCVVQLPAVWILSAITVLVFGLLPRLTVVAWVALALCLLVSLVGQAAGLDQWVLDISPFTHLPKLPGGHVTALPLVVLLVIAAAGTVAGVTGFRRRDVPA